MKGPLQKSLPAENGYFFRTLRCRVLNDTPYRLWRVLAPCEKNLSFSASEHTFAEAPEDVYACRIRTRKTTGEIFEIDFSCGTFAARS